MDRYRNIKHNNMDNNIQNRLDKELLTFRQEFALKLLDKGYSTNLADKTTWSIQDNDLGFSISINMPDYAEYLENGTQRSKPHTPPFLAILDWVKVKNILPRANNGKLPSQVQLAWAIVKSAEKKGLGGIKPTHIISKTMEELNIKQRIYNIVGEELIKSFNNEVKNTLAK